MSKSNLYRALVRASQNLSVRPRHPELGAIKRRLALTVSELNNCHDELSRGGEPVLAEAINKVLIEIEAVLSVMKCRCD